MPAVGPVTACENVLHHFGKMKSRSGRTDRIEVAIVGGGCAAMAAAVELSRPQHRGKYHITVYQSGWRLGGKGASGRGPADRIEEHGLHLWMGFYENAFRLMRECYAELGRDPLKCRIADWRDAFVAEPFIGIGSEARRQWLAHFPPGDGLPGDPLTDYNPFTTSSYLVRSATLLRTLLASVPPTVDEPARQGRGPDPSTSAFDLNIASSAEMQATVRQYLKYGVLTTVTGLVSALRFVELAFRAAPLPGLNLLMPLLETVAENLNQQFAGVIADDPELRSVWEVVDLLLAFQRGALRFNLLSEPSGFDCLNAYDTREWLRLNGASERSINSDLMRGLYDLAMAYEDGDVRRPRMAAGLGLRACLRMFFTYRGAMMWKMQAGMGDIVFAPFYEVLKRRGVSFKFFHRLRNVSLGAPATEAPGHVAALEFDVQAEVKNADEYQPLIDIRGLPCWPSAPDYGQLVDGARLRAEGWEFESHWERRRSGAMTLQVGKDFDLVVLGVGLGAIPDVCGEIVASNPRWAAMVERVKTIPTQAFQLWLRTDMASLGWEGLPTTMSGFAKPFDTWADMRHLIREEKWPVRPRSLIYLCGAMREPPKTRRRESHNFAKRCREQVRDDAVAWIRSNLRTILPKSVNTSGKFRWELLVDPGESVGSRPSRDESRFASQFWTANVNPSDRYVLSVPGSIEYRISPLDYSYDNLTIAGDWTDCGLNLGCVESAFISGRLAAHAIAALPKLEDIIGYDHP